MSWLSGFSYRKSITLSRAPGAVTDYQMRMPVFFSNPYPDATALVSQTHVWTGSETWTEAQQQAATDIISAFGTRTWVRHDGNPVFDLGASGKWDGGDVQGPVLILDGSTWRLFYSGSTPGGVTQRIGLATSSDGKTWTRFDANNPVLTVGSAGAWDDSMVSPGGVIKDGSTLKMWYHGNDGATWKIGLATSENGGQTWTKDASNPVLSPSVSGWDDKWVGQCRVIKEGSTYKMWYVGYSSAGANPPQIGYATSPDGVTWTKYGGNPVIPLGGAGTWDDSAVELLGVFKIADKYICFYEGTDTAPGGRFKIGFAYSADGIAWTKHASNPIFSYSTSWQWDAYHALHPHVIWNPTKKTFYLYYAGTDGTSWAEVARIGLAFQADGLNLEGHGLSDFGDIRFTQSDGTTLLNYCVESQVNNDHAMVLIKFDSIGTGETTFYAYYGKADATTLSDPNAAHAYYHTFEGETVGQPPSKFLDTASLQIFADTGEGARAVKNTADYSARMDMGNISNVWLRGKIRNVSGVNPRLRYEVRQVDGNNVILVGQIWGNGVLDIYENISGTGYRRAYTSFTWGTGWHDMDIKIYGTTIQVKLDNKILSYTSLGSTNSGKGAIAGWASSINAWDFIRIRKYDPPEPAWGSWGSEEQGSFTLIIADLSHADSLEAITLTQVHNLVVSNLVHADAIENIILTQIHQLVVQALAHAHSIDGVVLSQIHQLVVQALAHAHSIDAPTLTQIHQLVVQALNHSHALDGVSLSQIHNLVVQNLAHTHGIENVTLLLSFLLVVEDLIHSHSLGSVNLFRTHNLVVQALQHDHILLGFLDLIQGKKIIPENFGYQMLKLESPPPLPGGAFSYEHSSSGVINEVQEGAFNYEHSKTTFYENLSGWFVVPWFSDWFREREEVFQFEHLKLMESAPAEESSFEFENLKPTISPVTLNDDFKYRRF